MAETGDSDNAAFWLPSHFLTDDDFLPGDDLDFLRVKNQPTPNFELFSNGFDPFLSHSALDSPVSSTDTERDADFDNPDNDLLAELTRQLAQSSLHDSHTLSEKPWRFSTSPQSTLTGFGPWSNRSGLSSNGSPNGPSQVPSPPLTPAGAKNDAAWELLYEAAGQVAMLKMNAIAAQLNQQQQNRGLLGAPCNSSLSATKSHHHINAFYDYPNTNQLHPVKRQEGSMWGQGREELYCQHHKHRRSCGGANGGALGLPQSAWPPLRAGQTQQPPHYPHNHRQQSGAQGGTGMRAVLLGGTGSGSGSGAAPAVKRKSTGTGVFIPRRYGAQQPDPRKKPAGYSTVLLPARVVQALNLDLEEVNNGVNLNSQSRLSTGFVTDYDIMMARRNALLSQQRGIFRPEGSATMVGHDIRLPIDWTY